MMMSDVKMMMMCECVEDDFECEFDVVVDGGCDDVGVSGDGDEEL